MEDLVYVLTELEKLKTVDRGLNVGDRKESSAEHSWSAMLIADILIDELDENLDRSKVLEYLLYHDLVEVYAGDAKFDNPAEMINKEENEKVAFLKIQSLLPKPSRFRTLIEEYELRNTREAEFAKAIDCIDACIRNLNQEYSEDSKNFTESLIRTKYTPHISKFELTQNLFEALLAKLKEQKKI